MSKVFLKKSLSFRLLASVINVCFIASFITPTRSFAQSPADLGLPAPGTMISLTSAYVPVIAKGLRVHPENPILFDFLIDTGNSGLKTNDQRLKSESEKLIKYFLASLTTPEQDLWVNLSPYEKDRIIPDQLGQTEMGRDMLAQDYILKQLTASLIYPEKELGKEFWAKVYAKAQALYGSSEVPVNTFNKVWIVADKAKVYVHSNTAFVVNAHLKVMLEEDYLAMSKQNNVGNGLKPFPTESNNVGSQIIREIVLPELEKEVNSGKNFANLRQIFNSMILATWYKKNLKEALLNQVYTNKNKVAGIKLDDQTIKDQIYQDYLKAYKKGVFNYIKEDAQASGQAAPRKYFSGGIKGDLALTVTENRHDSEVAAFGVHPVDGAMLAAQVIMPKDGAVEGVDFLVFGEGKNRTRLIFNPAPAVEHKKTPLLQLSAITQQIDALPIIRRALQQLNEAKAATGEYAKVAEDVREHVQMRAAYEAESGYALTFPLSSFVRGLFEELSSQYQANNDDEGIRLNLLQFARVIDPAIDEQRLSTYVSTWENRFEYAKEVTAIYMPESGKKKPLVGPKNSTFNAKLPKSSGSTTGADQAMVASLGYLGTTDQLGINPQQLSVEIEKELKEPGTGQIPSMFTISDEHGTINKMDSLLVDMFRSVPAGDRIPVDFVLNPDETIAKQLAEFGINMTDYKGQLFIHNLGDFMDRGPYGVKVFYRSKELIDAGLSDFVIGNHDQWMFMNLKAFHLPFYDNFEFYGYKDEYDSKSGGGNVRFLLSQKHKENPETRKASWWAHQLAEHRAFYQKKQKEEWAAFDKRINGTDGLFNDVTKGMNEEQIKKWTRTSAGRVWGKLRGVNPEVGEVSTGVKAVGTVSISWWSELLREFTSIYEHLYDEEHGDLKDPAIRQAWISALTMMKEDIIPQLKKILESQINPKGKEEPKWWYRIFEAINSQNYTSPEWWAQDWAYHKGWGPTVFKEINDTYHEGRSVVTVANYLDEDSDLKGVAVLKEIAAFFKQNYTLHIRDIMQTDFLHAFLPIDPKTGEFYFNYKSIQYQGIGKQKGTRPYWEGLAAIARDIREAKDDETLIKVIYEAKAVVNGWYADNTTEAKAIHVAKAFKDIGIRMIAEANGINWLITGHVPMHDYQKIPEDLRRIITGHIVATEDRDKGFADSDGGMGEKFGGGAKVLIQDRKGFRLRGYESKSSADILDKPRTIVVQEEAGTEKLKVLYRNDDPIPPSIFLKNVLKAIRALEAKDAAMTAKHAEGQVRALLDKAGLGNDYSELNAREEGQSIIIEVKQKHEVAFFLGRHINETALKASFPENKIETSVVGRTLKIKLSPKDAAMTGIAEGDLTQLTLAANEVLAQLAGPDADFNYLRNYAYQAISNNPPVGMSMEMAVEFLYLYFVDHKELATWIQTKRASLNPQTKHIYRNGYSLTSAQLQQRVVELLPRLSQPVVVQRVANSGNTFFQLAQRLGLTPVARSLGPVHQGLVISWGADNGTGLVIWPTTGQVWYVENNATVYPPFDLTYGNTALFQGFLYTAIPDEQETIFGAFINGFPVPFPWVSPEEQARIGSQYRIVTGDAAMTAGQAVRSVLAVALLGGVLQWANSAAEQQYHRYINNTLVPVLSAKRDMPKDYILVKGSLQEVAKLLGVDKKILAQDNEGISNDPAAGGYLVVRQNKDGAMTVELHKGDRLSLVLAQNIYNALKLLQKQSSWDGWTNGWHALLKIVNFLEVNSMGQDGQVDASVGDREEFQAALNTLGRSSEINQELRDQVVVNQNGNYQLRLEAAKVIRNAVTGMVPNIRSPFKEDGESIFAPLNSARKSSDDLGVGDLSGQVVTVNSRFITIPHELDTTTRTSDVYTGVEHQQGSFSYQLQVNQRDDKYSIELMRMTGQDAEGMRVALRVGAALDTVEDKGRVVEFAQYLDHPDRILQIIKGLDISGQTGFADSLFKMNRLREKDAAMISQEIVLQDDSTVMLAEAKAIFRLLHRIWNWDENAHVAAENAQNKTLKEAIELMVPYAVKRESIPVVVKSDLRKMLGNVEYKPLDILLNTKGEFRPFIVKMLSNSFQTSEESTDLELVNPLLGEAKVANKSTLLSDEKGIQYLSQLQLSEMGAIVEKIKDSAEDQKTVKGDEEKLEAVVTKVKEAGFIKAGGDFFSVDDLTKRLKDKKRIYTISFDGHLFEISAERALKAMEGLSRSGINFYSPTSFEQYLLIAARIPLLMVNDQIEDASRQVISLSLGGDSLDFDRPILTKSADGKKDLIVQADRGETEGSLIRISVKNQPKMAALTIRSAKRVMILGGFLFVYGKTLRVYAIKQAGKVLVKEEVSNQQLRDVLASIKTDHPLTPEAVKQALAVDNRFEPVVLKKGGKHLQLTVENDKKDTFFLSLDQLLKGLKKVTANEGEAVIGETPDAAMTAMGIDGKTLRLESAEWEGFINRVFGEHNQFVGAWRLYRERLLGLKDGSFKQFLDLLDEMRGEIDQEVTRAHYFEDVGKTSLQASDSLRKFLKDSLEIAFRKTEDGAEENAIGTFQSRLSRPMTEKQIFGMFLAQSRGMLNRINALLDAAMTMDDIKKRLTGKTILVVDNEDHLRDLVARILKRNGANVLEAVNGKEALKVFSAGGIDLVLTDIDMPEMNGKQLVSELQLRESGLPILAWTGIYDEHIAFFDHLRIKVPLLKKPIDAMGVLRAVAEKLPVAPAEDRALVASPTGGIDLNSKNLLLDINGDKINITFDPRMMEQFKSGDFSGVRPVIINITPVANLNNLLGMADSPNEGRLAKV